ncbi:hypothetical protein BO86DRAFT_389303 [Aspergillus japonicus CBS 114.51]|uniref:Uncharacterized protein n=2 Tax=Aspergillus TaxID=5052 RepID=A0A2V5HWN1_ASPV1|nr:hypothetical protein BO86DRAFT_389303 [Aspergillus japonicus CBS 114.51]PYI20690.1 hypothetical protein BO99DRAFT_401597 [Aspergillus violaceofuscus CBS 115571]RAH81811.1 hypothetical protein BO86DRAFT_389303 [Aspergillus japonicus CBS 114.51]
MDPAQLSRLGRDMRFLPVPVATDNLEETLKKLQDLTEVATQGNSLALFTGLELVALPTRDPEKLAKEQMSPKEVLLYEAWKARKPNPNVEESLLLSFDWTANVAPVPQGAHSLKKLTKRAAAMDVIFDHHDATPENAAWLTSRMPQTLPLVKAVAKVSNCKQSLEQQRQAHFRGLTDMEAAEVETIRKIVAVAEVNTNRELERMRRLARSIRESASIIKSRAEALQESRDPVSALHGED